MNPNRSNYSELVTEIGTLLAKGREQVAQSVSTILVQTHWLIGRHTVDFEQGGKEKAVYESKAVGSAFERADNSLLQKIWAFQFVFDKTI